VTSATRWRATALRDPCAATNRPIGRFKECRPRVRCSSAHWWTTGIDSAGPAMYGWLCARDLEALWDLAAPFALRLRFGFTHWLRTELL